MTKKNVELIRICLGSSCYSRGNAENLQIIKNYLDAKQLEDIIDFRGHLCNEKCNKGPVVQIDQKEYENVTPDNIPFILKTHFE